MKRIATLAPLAITALLLFVQPALAKEGVITKMSDLPYLERKEEKAQLFSLINRQEQEDIVILYDTPQENNIGNLDLSIDDVEAGRSVSDSVDVIRPSDSTDTEDLIDSIKDKENVLAVDKDEKRHIQSVPNDYYYDIQYYFDRVGADKTWQTTSKQAVKVAVIDSGVDASHEDLVGRVEQSGYDYISQTVSKTDRNGHGTEVAGTIAAVANNKKGVAGIAGLSDVKVVPYCTMDSSGEGYVSDICSSLMEISQRDDIQVVNLSFGGYGANEAEENACRQVYKSGKVLVASAGNEDSHKLTYPAGFDEVIAVGAVNSHDQRCSSSDWGSGCGSNYGKGLELVAPGDDIICATPSKFSSKGTLYHTKSGTSFSCPIVAGACAVLMGQNRQLTPEKVREVLQETAEDLHTYGKDEQTGYGMLRLDKALAAVSDQPTHVESIAFNKTSLNLTVGEKEKLEVIIKPENADNKKYQLLSEDTSIATVSQDGTVTAHKAGKVLIVVVANDGAVTGTCEVTVKEKKPEVVKVSSVVLDQSNIALDIGDHLQLNAKVSPENATDKGVSWSTNNTHVVVVDHTGYIIAVGKGTARVTVTTNDQNKTDFCYVTVKSKDVDVTGVTVSPETLSLQVGDTSSIHATVTPSNATNPTIVWESSNPGVASISPNGTVRALAVGNAQIKVSSVSTPNCFDTCEVTVKERVIPVTGITLNKKSVSLTVGEYFDLDEKVSPENASNKKVSWASSNSDVASISSSGRIKARKAGTATITVTTSDGGKTAKCSVTVKNKIIKVTGLKISSDNYTMVKGSTLTLKATIQPSNATNKSVKYQSSDPDVASVNSSGRVVALSPGSANISVQSVSGNKRVTCKIKVVKKSGNLNTKIKYVSLNKSSLVGKVGTSQKLSATVYPNLNSLKTVKWKSSNPRVATVNSSGRVSLKKTGTVSITATAADPAVTATCRITVKPKVSQVSLPLRRKDIKVGASLCMKAKVIPTNAYSKAVTWKSSNPAVATVDSDGTIKGIKPGEATITVTTADQRKTAECRITVFRK